MNEDIVQEDKYVITWLNVHTRESGHINEPVEFRKANAAVCMLNAHNMSGTIYFVDKFDPIKHKRKVYGEGMEAQKGIYVSECPNCKP